MEKGISENSIIYRADDETIYVLSPVSQIAGMLGITQKPANAEEDLEFIWKDSGVSKLILFIPAEREDHVKVIRKLGFKQEGRLRKATPEGDLLVFGQYRI